MEKTKKEIKKIIIRELEKGNIECAQRKLKSYKEVVSLKVYQKLDKKILKYCKKKYGEKIIGYSTMFKQIILITFFMVLAINFGWDARVILFLLIQTAILIFCFVCNHM